MHKRNVRYVINKQVTPIVFLRVSSYPNGLECVFSELIILVGLSYYFLDSYMSVCAYGSISDNYLELLHYLHFCS